MMSSTMESGELNKDDDKNLVNASTLEDGLSDTRDHQGNEGTVISSEMESLSLHRNEEESKKLVEEGSGLDVDSLNVKEMEQISVKDVKDLADISTSDDISSDIHDHQGNCEEGILSEMKSVDLNEDNLKLQHGDEGEEGLKHRDHQKIGEEGIPSEMKSLNVDEDNLKLCHEDEGEEGLKRNLDETSRSESENAKKVAEMTDEVAAEEEADPVFDGTENPELEAMRSSSERSLDANPQAQPSLWPEKAAAIKNFVKEKGAVAVVVSVLRRLSGGKDDSGLRVGEEKSSDSTTVINQEGDSSTETKPLQKPGERATWNPLNYIKIGRDTDVQSRSEQEEVVNMEKPEEEPAVKGRIIVYTRLGCQECKEVRSFMQQKRLKYIEINIDIYPSRKLELEKNVGSSSVPRVYFNDFLVGGLSELKAMDESGKLDEKINAIINEKPSPTAPLPPLPGEDDLSGSGKVDELASIVRKMKETIVLKDRFYKMRRFNNCFLGSEAVDFFSEDQYLERQEAVEFGRKLVNKNFFRHILDENIFEDGNHLYRFLEHDPIVSTQCHNIPRGIIDIQPKPVVEIASRLRFLSFAIFEAYVSEDGRHVDYRSIYGSEEYKRYLRIVEELQRVELGGLSREEKLAFFINLYNMMAIHAILTWGYPVGALDRRRFLGDFKYVVGGCTYSLSAIQNGILRGNQRPPYNITKPFGPRDRRLKVALPYPEPLIHFALVCGTKSGPALRCFSPGNIDKELIEAARDFLRNGGVVFDAETKAASVSKILRWYSVDFGKNEVEVLKHAANYLEPPKSEELLELLANAQLRVTYQPYDWGLNC